MKRNFSDSRGFAALGLVIAVLVIAVVGGGAYYASQRVAAPAEGDTTATTTADASVPTSLRALLGLGQSMSCTFSKIDGVTTSSGVVYIAGGRMRGDFKSEGTPAGTVTSHMVNDGAYSYVWSDAAGQGIKMKFEAAANANAGAAPGVAANWDDSLSYKCSPWGADESLFSPPANVEFLDAAALGGMGVSAAAGAGAGAGQCASCDSVPEAARAQCRAALGC